MLARIKNIMVPLSFGVVFLLLWESAVRVFDLKPYFLAAPSKIFEQFTKNTSRIWDATSVSGTNALVGLIIGTILGIAVLLARGKTLTPKNFPPSCGPIIL